MARAINRLTTLRVKALAEPGLHADGAGLYLRIDQTLNKRWVWLFKWQGRRREMGLGSAQTVELKEARKRADAARTVLAAGLDPIAARTAEAFGEMTFGALAERVITDLAQGWRSPKAEAQWRASLTTHAAKLWPMKVAQIETEHVLAALSPIWQRLPETAGRVRARVERILDVATVEGLRTGDNPARWKGHLQVLLARQQRIRGHHTAMPYEHVPAFMRDLRGREAMAGLALEFAVLTVTRTTETREARPEEIVDGVWIIPAERMKAGREHRVPLSTAALAVVERALAARGDNPFLFPGEEYQAPLSRMAMLMLLRRMEVDVTVHGFRSSFRDWAGDCTDFPRELIEEALAHAVGSTVERAYRRRTALEKRRGLMEAWGKFCAEPSNVVHLRA